MLADWIFTTPAIVIQPVTGAWLMVILGYRFDSAWFAWVAALYVIAGACWFPVVVISIDYARMPRAPAPGIRCRRVTTG